MSDYRIFATTGVFWDAKDFEVSSYMDLIRFRKGVDRALRRELFCTGLRYFVYDSEDRSDAYEYYGSAGMGISVLGDKRTRLNAMLQDMVTWAVWNKCVGGEKILMVISKDIPGEETDFVTLLDSMCIRDYAVFLVVPDGCQKKDYSFPAPCLAWYWSTICAGDFSIHSVVDPKRISHGDSDTDSDTNSGCSEDVTPADAEEKKLDEEKALFVSM